MFYKLSNTAKLHELEGEFEKKFKYPALYTPRLVINGLGEDNLSIITNKESHLINIAIWGLMPDGYKEEWSTFQNATNTLNISKEMLYSSKWMLESLEEGRCLIIVNGFFTYYVQNGVIYPYYVALKSGKPFLLGGIYNKLEDGFLSCSPLTVKARPMVSKFHNVDDQMPLAIPDSVSDEWLSGKTHVGLIEKIIDNPPSMDFRANPIAKEFFKNNIVYDSILQPAYYENLLDREDEE
jgi:putative SOS response-associated peptidase YedK